MDATVVFTSRPLTGLLGLVEGSASPRGLLLPGLKRGNEKNIPLDPPSKGDFECETFPSVDPDSERFRQKNSPFPIRAHWCSFVVQILRVFGSSW